MIHVGIFFFRHGDGDQEKPSEMMNAPRNAPKASPSRLSSMPTSPPLLMNFMMKRLMMAKPISAVT